MSKNTPICGVYQLSAPNGNCYIGSSKNVKNRWREHKTEALAGRHSNEALRRAYNKYGDLTQRLLLICEEKDLLLYEQSCLDLYKPEYNLTLAAGRVEMTLAMRTRISKSNKEHHRAHPERAKRHSEVMKTKPSNQKGLKRSDENKKLKSEQTSNYFAEDEIRREKARLRAIGNKHNLGTKWSDEAKLKQSLRVKGTKWSIERRASHVARRPRLAE